MKRRDFLGTSFGALAAASLPIRARAGLLPAKNLIVVFAAGGWDTTYVLDPKTDGSLVDSPAGTPQTFGNLTVFTDASRPNVTSFFQAWAPVSAVVNGIAVNSIAHPECRQRILTGTREETSPDLAAIAAFELGWDLPAPYLVLGTAAFTGELASGSARVGNLNQIVALLDPAASATGAYPIPPYVPTSAEETAIRAYVQARANRVAQVRASAGKNQRRLQDYLDSLGRGDLLRANKAGFGSVGGTLSLAAQRALAVDMIEQGISHAVHVDSAEGWDTHDTNSDQSQSYEDLFAQLNLLADDLATRPGKQAGNVMLDETVVVVLSEMGRTPKLNAAAGKDHWPATSALVFGAGVASGNFGATSASLEAEKIDYATGTVSASGKTLETSALVAGVLTLCGADPTGFLPDAEVFDAFVA